MNQEDLDLAIETIPYFRRLRSDERARVADLMNIVHLEAGSKHPVTCDNAVVLIVVSGAITLVRQGIDLLSLDDGDWTDDLRAISGNGCPGALTAQSDSIVALLDKASLDRLFAQMPIVAVPLVVEIGKEVMRRNDLTRELMLANNTGLPAAALKAILWRKRRRLRRRRHISPAGIGSLLLRALVIEPSRRLTFWIFLGVLTALVMARSVVAMILGNGLQDKLFALIACETGNPIHVHHFNYGLIIVALVGLLSFTQLRRALRTLSFTFGVGVGLVVDEFALLWNLNPDYYQPSSLIAAAMVIFALFQIVYFRSLYLGVARRLVAWMKP